MAKKKTEQKAVYQSFLKVQPFCSVGYCMRMDNHFRNYTPFKSRPVRNSLELSRKAMIRMRNCFQWLMTISERKTVFELRRQKYFYYKLGFITLTLSSSQKHSDDYIKEHLLQPLFRWMKRQHYCYSNIWKAEVQSNGNIHFHITVNKFIHWRRLQIKWNSLQMHHGYIPQETDLSNTKKFKSTQIKCVVKVGAMVAYVQKYFFKKQVYANRCSLVCDVEENYYAKEMYNWKKSSDGSWWQELRKVKGRMWGASENLNQSSLILESGTEQYSEMGFFLENHPQVEQVQLPHSFMFKYHAPIISQFPDKIKQQLKQLINKTGEKEVKQTYIEVDSLL